MDIGNRCMNLMDFIPEFGTAIAVIINNNICDP
jgi:hypothetical protein